MKNWNLMFVAGNPEIFKKVISASGNPMKRSEALKGAKTIDEKGWRVWVGHKDTGERIYESELEKEYK